MVYDVFCCLTLIYIFSLNLLKSWMSFRCSSQALNLQFYKIGHVFTGHRKACAADSRHHVCYHFSALFYFSELIYNEALEKQNMRLERGSVNRANEEKNGLLTSPSVWLTAAYLIGTMLYSLNVNIPSYEETYYKRLCRPLSCQWEFHFASIFLAPLWHSMKQINILHVGYCPCAVSFPSTIPNEKHSTPAFLQLKWLKPYSNSLQLYE